jgi:hypothetical protein
VISFGLTEGKMSKTKINKSPRKPTYISLLGNISDHSATERRVIPNIFGIQDKSTNGSHP